MKSNDKRFMLEAIAEAEKAQKRGDWPIGCIIVLDNKIVARGSNRVYSGKSKILHAEIDAISKIAALLAERGREATMYITYDPCPMCFGAIILNHIGKVVCGSNIDKSGALEMSTALPERFSEKKYKFELVKDFMREECQAVFMQGVPSKKLNL